MVLTLLSVLKSLMILRMSVCNVGELLNRNANPGTLFFSKPVCNSRTLRLLNGWRRFIISFLFDRICQNSESLFSCTE
jgi:hypothetical protein